MPFGLFVSFGADSIGIVYAAMIFHKYSCRSGTHHWSDPNDCALGPVDFQSIAIARKLRQKKGWLGFVFVSFLASLSVIFTTNISQKERNYSYPFLCCTYRIHRSDTRPMPKPANSPLTNSKGLRVSTTARPKNNTATTI